jgi:hypothetical protein
MHSHAQTMRCLWLQACSLSPGLFLINSHTVTQEAPYTDAASIFQQPLIHPVAKQQHTTQDAQALQAHWTAGAPTPHHANGEAPQLLVQVLGTS